MKLNRFNTIRIRLSYDEIKRFLSFKKKKKKIYHIGYRRADYSSDITYRFFNYANLYDQDDILGIWQRVFGQLPIYKPDIVLLDFKDGHTNIINEHEKNRLLNFASVIELHHAEGSS